jgi:hypothetical protein
MQPKSNTAYFKAHFTVSAYTLRQEYTNPKRQVAVATTFCTSAPKIFGSRVWYLLRVTHLAPRILKWPLDLKKNMHTCITCNVQNDIFYFKTL